MTRLQIALTGRRPVSIESADWPIIAEAKGHTGEHACQANEEFSIRVRQHADGRAIIIARRDSGPGGMPITYEGGRSAVLLDSSDAIADAILECCRDAGVPDSLAESCLAKLPAEEI